MMTNSELIIKKALRYNTLEKDYNELYKKISRLSKIYNSRVLSKMKDKLKNIKQTEFVNDRQYKNFLNLLKVALLEIDELELRLQNTIADENQIKSNLNSFPSLSELT